MKKIYLACPYTDKSKVVMEERFQVANECAMALMEQGFIVFSPISHSHPIAQYSNRQTDHEFWMKQDLPQLRDSDIFVQILIDGLNTSLGCTIEQQEAQKHNIDIIQMTPSEIKRAELQLILELKGDN
jgi:hypothetical protein